MRILYLLHSNDSSYRIFIKPNSPGFVTSGKVLINEQINYLSELDSLCDAHECSAIITTDYKILKILFPAKRFKDADTDGAGLTVNDFAGNTTYTPKGRKILIQLPLRHLVSVPSAPFLFNHFMHKLSPLHSHKFVKLPALKPIYVETVAQAEDAVSELSKASLIAFDIETSSNQRITHISFASISNTYSFAIKDLMDLTFIRKILMNDALKIAQNGKYDCLHLIHWGCPIKNYYFDTYGMMQCYLAELPRTLDFIGSFFLDDILYWKDESHSDMALYNAKDSHVTLLSFLSWMRTAPAWAMKNYADKFPITFPHLAAEFEGIAVNLDKLTEVTMKQRAIVDESLNSLNKSLGTKTFNPGSPTQVKSLLQLLSPKAKITGSDAIALRESSTKHPLNALICGKITAYREAKKLHTTYLDAPLWHNRVTYSLNTFGTETGRTACRASSFGEPIKAKKSGGFTWRSYGIQVQNMSPAYKVCLEADPDFLLVEMDKSQSESRCTAYLAEEPNLIEAVEESPDFHSFNASAFFGIPFEEIFDAKTGKKLNVPLRDIAKKVGHSANYNASPQMLIQIVGEEILWKAKALLKLSPRWGLLEIAEFLMDSFDKAYPGLRDKQDGWYGRLITEWVENKGLITTPDGWTRKFFGNPLKSKPAMNALASHKPQHLSAAIVDKGYFRIWLELDNPKTFRVKASIHDSILFQVHKDHLHLVEEAKRIFDETSKIDVCGKEMFIPSDITKPKKSWK